MTPGESETGDYRFGSQLEVTRARSEMTEWSQCHLSSLRRLAAELAEHCPAKLGRTCHIVKNLPVANALLNKLNVEVEEFTPGKLSLCQAQPIGSRIKDSEDVHAEESIAFLYTLLQKHGCIDSVEFKPHLRQEPVQLITNALFENKFLTCLRVHHAYLSEQATMSLFAAVCQLLSERLRELSLEKLDISCLPQTLDGFREALARTKSLKRLTLLNIRERAHAWMNALNVGLTGLQANSTVTSLKMDTSYQYYYEGAKVLNDFLANTVTLAELHIYCSSDCSSDRSLDSVFEALAGNRTITRLTLRKFSVKDMKPFRQLLDANKVLEDVSFYASPLAGIEKTPTACQVSEQHVRTIVQALESRTSLRRLSLDWNCTPSTVYRLLVASSGSPSLRELHLGDVIVDYVDALRWAFINVRTDVAVTAARCISTNGTLSELIPFWKPEDKESCVHCLYSVNLKDVSRALSSHRGDYLTSLSVVLGKHSTLTTVHALALYLASTHKLQELQLRLESVPQNLQQVLFAGFQRNVSLERLCIFGTENLCIPENMQQVLFSWMADSKRLYSINVKMHGYDTKHMLEVLASSQHRNHVLTSLAFSKSWADQSVLETNLKMVRRNRKLLRFAAAFVHGSMDKRAAHAYSIAALHPQLSEVVQRIGCCGRDVARLLMSEATLRLQVNFWQLTGIVKNRITCLTPPTPRKVQFDRFNFEILNRIASYLKVGDVVDDDESQDCVSEYPYLEDADTGACGRAVRRQRLVL
ncbi:hypothetical protein MTO96_018566 [Rhipicephalus appendiculatus]